MASHPASPSDSPRHTPSRADAVTLRPMREDDLPLLHGWLQRNHVRCWWGGDELATLDGVIEHYLPRTLGQGGVTPYIAMLADRPIGYCQSYLVVGDDFWPDETDPGARGCDQFLGEGDLLGQGLGTQLVRTLVDTLFADPAVTKVQTDPSIDNARAIHCYEKAGFRALKRVTTPDGEALLMLRERG